MKSRSFFRTIIVLIVATTMLLAGTSIGFAATAPKSITYKGSGKVTVNFKSEVTYDDVAISIKDNSGKTYKTSISKKTKSYISFLIKGYKTGKTYEVSVSGISGGTVAGSFKIYSKSKAITIAKNDVKKVAKKAKKKVVFKNNAKATSSTYKSLSVWKVTFTANDRSYTYMITQQTGKILYSKFK